MIHWRKIAAAVGMSIALVAFTGCASNQPAGRGDASSSPSQSATAASFNDQDVMFAQMMIPHHAQAVEMSDVMLAKDDIDPRVIELAEQIREAQGPEIVLLTSWLEGWGESTEPSGHAGHGMEGMMSDQDMQALDTAGGEDAARLFLDQMIAHHTGALSMAEVDVEQGLNADATQLAKQIVDDQRAEIDTMNSILGTL